MPNSKTPGAPSTRTDATRERVLAAAERLLRDGGAEFAMRELAAAAGVSFATPFNLFGSKAAIMHALSAQRIGTMTDRFGRSETTGDAVDRVLAAVAIAVAVMLVEPTVNRAVIGTLGAAGGEPGQVYRQSRALWTQAIGDGRGLDPELADLARATLPDQLAVAFRGVLSFWTAGEIGDADLPARARAAAAALLVGFTLGERRAAVLARLAGPEPGAASDPDPTGRFPPPSG